MPFVTDLTGPAGPLEALLDVPAFAKAPGGKPGSDQGQTGVRAAWDV